MLEMTWDAQPKAETPKIETAARKKTVPWASIVLSALAAGLLVFVGFLAYSAYMVYTLPGRVAENTRAQAAAVFEDLRALGQKASERLGSALKFSPTVVVGDTVVSNGFSNIAHLVLNEAQFTQERQFSHTFLGSTKRLQISGEFRSRAGINLSEESRIMVSGRGIVVVLPPPEVLTVELRNLDFVQDSDGLWNRIRPEERERHVNELIARARESAQALHTRENLEKQAREMLLDVLRPLTDSEITVVFAKAKDGVVENPLAPTFSGEISAEQR